MKKLSELKNKLLSVWNSTEPFRTKFMEVFNKIGYVLLVIWKWIYSTRFDSKRCKAENPNLYNLYAVDNNYRKFSVV